MRDPFRRHRLPYIERLAHEPLLCDVPHHLLPAVARSLDEICLQSGNTLCCTPEREDLVICDGVALLSWPDGSVALITAGTGIGAHPLGAAAEASLRLTALTPVRCFVIGRRERTLLREIAPKLTHVPRVTAPGPAPDRPAAGHDASGTRRLVVLSSGSDAK